MSTEQATLDGSKPDEEPWKDADTLFDLYHSKNLDQSEIAERLGTTPSTISYWMRKLQVNTSETQHSRFDGEPSDKCAYVEICENETPGANNSLCTDCMDKVRKNSRLQAVDIDEYDDVLEYIKQLYETYD